MSTPTCAAIYVRISKDRDGSELGVDRQRADCEELAERLGWTVAGVYMDNDLSASTGKPRPAYLRLLADLESGTVDGVLAWHTDRLHRRPAELETFIGLIEKLGVPVVTATAGAVDLSTPTGRLVARLLGATARHETEHHRARVRRAKKQRQEDGKWPGGPRAFGYEQIATAEAAPVIREVEAKAIRTGCAALLAGQSLSAVARDWNAVGLRTPAVASRPEGRPWVSTTVRRTLSRASLAGLVEHGGEIVGAGEWPAIISEATCRGVRALLSDPARRTSPGNARSHLLSGIARCWCGLPLRAATNGGHASCRAASYRCRSERHVSRGAAGLDDYIERHVIARLERDDATDLLLQPAPNTAELATKAEALRQRLAEQAELHAAGVLDTAQLAAGSRKLHAQLDMVQRELAESARVPVLAGLVGVADVRDRWKKLDLSRKRGVVDALMTITVQPARRGRPTGWRKGEPYFDTETVVIEPKRPAA
ncbi:site-specific DNA recombinase [Streptacidiphilus sp. MAP12-16]|uniref:recombinase family protein n=1 Tax=Streptacidiphilus sp. MAP12-16 TaxID=3156300 RepID=UPI00351139AF